MQAVTLVQAITLIVAAGIGLTVAATVASAQVSTSSSTR